MHQYHLGEDEEEKDGELVVSKIFYQQPTKHISKGEAKTVPDEVDGSNIRSGPMTPKTIAPQPPRPKMNSLSKANDHDCLLLPVQECPEEESPLPIIHLKDEDMGSAWWASESQGIQEPDTEKIDELLCHEVLDPLLSMGDTSLNFHYPYMVDDNKEQLKKDANTADGFPGLDDIIVDTPPDFHLSIFVGGLDPNVTNDVLRQVFSPYGELVHVKIPAGKRCGCVHFVNMSKFQSHNKYFLIIK